MRFIKIDVYHRILENRRFQPILEKFMLPLDFQNNRLFGQNLKKNRCFQAMFK